MGIQEGITWFIAAFTIFLTVRYVARGILALWRKRRKRETERVLREILSGNPNVKFGGKYRRPRQWLPILDAWIVLAQTVMPDVEENSRLVGFFLDRQADLYFIRTLRSSSRYRRCRSAYYLG